MTSWSSTAARLASHFAHRHCAIPPARRSNSQPSALASSRPPLSDHPFEGKTAWLVGGMRLPSGASRLPGWQPPLVRLATTRWLLAATQVAVFRSEGRVAAAWLARGFRAPKEWLPRTNCAAATLWQPSTIQTGVGAGASGIPGGAQSGTARSVQGQDAGTLHGAPQFFWRKERPSPRPGPKTLN